MFEARQGNELGMLSEDTIGIKPAETVATETIVSNLVNWVEEAVMIPEYGLRIPGQRKNLCGTATDLVSIAARHRGIREQIHQVGYVHKLLGGNGYKAFFHYFNILKIENNKYLVDLTFGQFVNHQTGEIRQGRINPPSGSRQDFPVVDGLINSGYVLLTDNVLADYLKATTESTDKSYTDKARVDRIIRTQGLTVPISQGVWAAEQLRIKVPKPVMQIPLSR